MIEPDCKGDNVGKRDTEAAFVPETREVNGVTGARLEKLLWVSAFCVQSVGIGFVRHERILRVDGTCAKFSGSGIRGK